MTIQSHVSHFSLLTCARVGWTFSAPVLVAFRWLSPLPFSLFSFLASFLLSSPANLPPSRDDTRFLTVEVHGIPQVGNHGFQMSLNAITDDVKQRVVDLMFAAGYYSRRPWFRLNRRVWLAPDPSDPTAIPQAYYARCPYYRALQTHQASTAGSASSIVFWFQWTTPDSFRNPPHLLLPHDGASDVIDVVD